MLLILVIVDLRISHSTVLPYGYGGGVGGNLNCINERFHIILMCMIYFFYICHISCIVYSVYNHTGSN